MVSCSKDEEMILKELGIEKYQMEEINPEAKAIVDKIVPLYNKQVNPMMYQIICSLVFILFQSDPPSE